MGMVLVAAKSLLFGSRWLCVCKCVCVFLCHYFFLSVQCTGIDVGVAIEIFYIQMDCYHNCVRL